MARQSLGALTFALALAASSAVRITDVTCPAKCGSDLDCSLNGVCDTSSGVCQCGPSWTGECCTALNFNPAQLNASGYRHPLTSTWGGNIIPQVLPNGSTLHHMWIAEMAPNGTAGDPGAGSCGLTTWGSNSQITHVTSATGPLVSCAAMPRAHGGERLFVHTHTC
jgi:hypothetical protein